jgi:hypothetical protein
MKKWIFFGFPVREDPSEIGIQYLFGKIEISSYYIHTLEFLKFLI